MSTWIDFKELRKKLSFEGILDHYGVKIAPNGKQFTDSCPLPNHGERKKPKTFSANNEKGVFQCFECGAKGNILDFAVLMEKRNPKDGADVRRVALMWHRKLGGQAAEVSEPENEGDRAETGELPLGEPEVIVNAPLDFELKGLTGGHPSLLERGLTRETIAHFGLGYCERGYFAGRIAIPLHDFDSKLIGYAGRVVDDETVNAANPQYLFPKPRERDGKVFDFKKSAFLYNAHRLSKGTNDLYIVQGFPSVWWLTQHGYGHCVATLDADCSEDQAELIVELVTPPCGRVWIVPNGEPEGEEMAVAVMRHVGAYRFVRWLRLPEDKQPCDLSPDELKELFAW